MLSSTDTYTPVTFISDNTIVPDEDQIILISVRDADRQNYFLIGDIANKEIERSISKKLPITQERIYEAVGRFCGKSSRSVRSYAETASFYPVSVREEYDILPFTFFVYAKAKDNWKDILDFAMEHPSFTLDELRLRVTDSIGIQKKREYAGDIAGNDKSVLQIRCDEPLHREITESKPSLRVSTIVAVLGDLIDNLSRLLRLVPLSETVREKIETCIDQIRETLPEVLDDAGKR